MSTATEIFYGLQLTTPPAVEPLALAAVKTYLRVIANDQDSVITSLITRARQYVEANAKIQLITATWTLGLGGFPSAQLIPPGGGSSVWDTDNAIRPPRPRLQSVTSIKYIDTDEVQQTLDAGDYVVDTLSEPGRIVPSLSTSWPSTLDSSRAVVEVEYVAGFGDAASDVPESIKQAMLLLISHWYEHREAVIDAPVPVEMEIGMRSILSTEKHGWI